MKSILKDIPAKFQGNAMERVDPCNLCGSRSAMKIGEVDYWDLRPSDVAKCDGCGHIQIDPMLTEGETSKGCLAYYVEETIRGSEKSYKKNLIRNFRRGYLFGASLKAKGFKLNKVLELGPGSGYFAEGLRFAFPHIDITMMDVNAEVLKFIEEQHQNQTIETTFEAHIPELDNQFDLVIARDVIEHVIDFAAVLENVSKYLKDGGLFHFITPNGHEDVWKHYLTYNHKNERSELLINHVNYFDGTALQDFFEKNNYRAVDYYTYKLKTTRRGSGWKVADKLMAKVSEKKSASLYAEEKISELKEMTFAKEEVLNKWYINPKMKFLTNMVSWYQHANLIKVDPKLNVGHEIYGVFQISKKGQ